MANSTRYALQYRNIPYRNISFLYLWPQKITAQLLAWWSCLKNAYHLFQNLVGWAKPGFLLSFWDVWLSRGLTAGQGYTWRYRTENTHYESLGTCLCPPIHRGFSKGKAGAVLSQMWGLLITSHQLLHYLKPEVRMVSQLCTLCPTTYLPPFSKLSQSHFTHFWQA